MTPPDLIARILKAARDAFDARFTSNSYTPIGGRAAEEGWKAAAREALIAARERHLGGWVSIETLTAMIEDELGANTV